MIYSQSDDDGEEEGEGFVLADSIQDSPSEISWFRNLYSNTRNCFRCLMEMFVFSNLKYEKQPPTGVFYGFITPNFINSLGALYFLRLGYCIGEHGFVYTIISLVTTIMVIIFMQTCSYVLYHHRPYYGGREVTLFIILKKTFGIELTTILCVQKFVHHLLNCINNIVGLTILFSHFYLAPFFEQSSDKSRLIVAVTITSCIFLVIGVGISLLFFKIRTIFWLLSLICFGVSVFLSGWFFVSLIFQRRDVHDGYLGFHTPSNFHRNLLPDHDYRYSLKMSVPGNMVAIMSPLIMDISYCRSFKNIKRDHIRSALFMDSSLFIFTFVVIVLVTICYSKEALLYNVIIFLQTSFVPLLVSVLLTISMMYTISSYLQACTNLVDILIHYGEWKFFRKYFLFRKAVICFLIHISIFVIYILIEYIGINLYVISKFTALVTLIHIETYGFVMFLMLVIGRLPPKRQHITLFRKSLLGAFYLVGTIIAIVKMAVLSVQITGFVMAAQMFLFLVVQYVTSPYSGVLSQYFLLNQMKRVLRMSRFESRDRLKSLNIIHFVPTPKNSYPSIALFTLFNQSEGIYTISNIQHPRFYNEGEHLHRIRREREFWLAFLEEMQLNHRNLLLKFIVSHSVRRGIQGLCLTNEWKRNVAALGFPTVKKREVKLGRYGIDIFTSETLTECLRKFSTDKWQTKLRNQQEYIGILKDMLYIFQLNVIVYHRLDKLDKFVFSAEQKRKSMNLRRRKNKSKRRKKKKKKKKRSRKSIYDNDDEIEDEESEDGYDDDDEEEETGETEEISIQESDYKHSKIEKKQQQEEEDDDGNDGKEKDMFKDDLLGGFSYRKRVKKKKQYFDVWLFQEDLETNSSNIFCLKMLSYINSKWFENDVQLTYRLFYIVKSPALIPVYERQFRKMLVDCRIRKKVTMCIQCYSNLSHQYYYDSIPDLEKVMLYAEMLKKFSDKETAMIFCVFDPPEANELGGEYWKKLKALVKSVDTPILLFFAPEFEEEQDEDSQTSDLSTIY